MGMTTDKALEILGMSEQARWRSGYEPTDEKEAIETIREALKQSESLKRGHKDNEWTPLTRDTLPKEGEDVLIQYKTNVGDYMAVSRRIDYNYWVGFGRDVCVIAWKPLPEPYKRVKGEENGN